MRGTYLTVAVPKWLLRSYACLWANFQDKEFRMEDAKKVLSHQKNVGLILSLLRRAGWLSVTLDQKDARKRRYWLNSIEVIFEGIEKTGNPTKQKHQGEKK